MMQHFDQWRVHFSEAIQTNNLRRAQRFKRKISKVNYKIKVIIPKLLKPYTLQ